MRVLAVLTSLALVAHAGALGAQDTPESARAVFLKICTQEALVLGHRDAVLKSYVEDCVRAKLKVFNDHMSDPASAYLPESC